jgi:hypothetical protein
MDLERDSRQNPYIQKRIYRTWISCIESLATIFLPSTGRFQLLFHFQAKTISKSMPKTKQRPEDRPLYV